MADISRAVLFGKLDTLSFGAMESATTFCRLRGNAYVELAHWLHQMLQLPDSDLHRVIRYAHIDPAALSRDLTEALDRLPRGAASVSDISSQLEEAVERGWVYASLLFDAPKVRSAHVLVGMLQTPVLRNALRGMSREFDRVKLDDLVANFADVLDGSPEASTPAAVVTQEPDMAHRTDDALLRFTVDLTAQAREGRLDPVVGRDAEIRQVVDILMRRRQNNPILTGEAGVGKTAVVEGLALRIAAGDMPPALRDVSLRTLDVALLQAGAGVKGEFEARLRQVLEAVQAAPHPVILFIDEAHTLIGAGGAAGTGDAANLLKPALARGSVRTIAATTWSEYRRHIEKDPALTRRFQVVQVHEPEEARAVTMMRGLAAALETHHGVQVLDEAIEAAVKLSHRYLPARQLPDKSVSLLDTACARVAVSQHATPPAVDDAQRRIDALNTELEVIGREAAIGIDTVARREAAAAALQTETARLADLHARWQVEREMVEDILARREALREGAPHADLAALRERQAQLAAHQGDAPLVLPGVDRHAVAAVVQDWTGVPVLNMLKNEIGNVLRLNEVLDRRIIGQQHATQMIARRVQTSRAGLDDPEKPVGVFLLAGTSGVGKTETALALAEALYGGEQNLITINMSEYQEAHTVSLLKGAPPGYVGFGEGGVLTEAVRRRPHSVVLLDEVEKAHPDVHELFFQVFDKGRMDDSEGRSIDFRNTLILLTTNAGTECIAQLCRDPGMSPPMEVIERELHAQLLETFPPALLGRMVTIPYYPLSSDMLCAIIRLQLGRVAERVTLTHGVPFTYDESVVTQIAQRCTRMDSGGRMIDAILTNSVLPRISTEFLARVMDGKTLARVHVSVGGEEFTYAFD
ncbi:type VI secretion system ATPase TssH [Paraburkholderia sp. CNPSo 3281]|uniref:type VI secretion system ATPase TssH n=1 Tax=Paraburkholderia sp. CNPSo 3281 TaxID=2940933 RepID=UPI0020B6821E|nr:type VI secretion system ATPase TssH [Paraburkholderia sp. CNPSo 3281]MCP3718343.1 type VI secretion system ATPase TssH [Paraburkholderia sp. CNPSo 3281]